uniref:Uncharacterized protein n=1 Tax=Anguilla anguilla TaxID=7936 RepID=A0A0E9SIW0_ANGAN
MTPNFHGNFKFLNRQIFLLIFSSFTFYFFITLFSIL